MKRTISLLTAAVLCLGMLQGCGRADDAEEQEKKPPVMVLTSDAGGTPFEISPSGYEWSWKNSDGTAGGCVADAIHPLDENVLESDRLDSKEAAPWTVSFARKPASLVYLRWDVGSVGYYEATPKEKASMESLDGIILESGSIYCFTARFDESDGSGGRADYYLVTAGAGEAADPYDPAAFLQSDAYTLWWSRMREAVNASAENQAGMDGYYSRLLPLLLSDGENNSVCSPLNIYLALSMLAETAGGETRAQLLSALNVPDMETLRSRAQALNKANLCDNPLLKSLPANSLWMQDGYPYSAKVITLLTDEHRAGAYSGEMGSELFIRQMQEWTDEHTGGLLKEYTSQMTQDPETRLELISTIFYRASWLDPFNKNATDSGVFRGVKGEVDCRMMHRSSVSNYYWGDGFSAVSLGLSESGSMFFFLPDEGTNLSHVICAPQALSLVRDPNGYENSRYLIVNMSVPIFTASCKTELKDALSGLGITDAFDRDAADFSPLTAEPGVFLGKADYAAAVSIDEEGVTGAAYTDLGLCGSGMPPEEQVDFVLDRPFYFVVTGRDGSILFAGTVMTTEE